MNITIEAINVSAGSNDPKVQAQAFGDELAHVLEGLGIRMGAPA